MENKNYGIIHGDTNTEELVKPFPIEIDLSEWFKSLKKLHKDLGKNETLCPRCKGVGLIKTSVPYGYVCEEGLPYVRETLIACPECFNGVAKVCEYCRSIIPRHRTNCDCEAAIEAKRLDANRKRCQKMEDAPIADDALIKTLKCFYSDDYGYNNGYFFGWEDFFDYWRDSHDDADDRPLYVWSTYEVKPTLDAINLVDNMCEDLYETAREDIPTSKIKELQDFLNSWCESCGVGSTYFENNTYKVKIPWEDFYND